VDHPVAREVEQDDAVLHDQPYQQNHPIRDATLSGVRVVRSKATRP
jgi:hypothetical protein